MKSSELLFALCKADESEFHLHVFNTNGSMVRVMKKFYVGFTLKRGTPKEGECYFFVSFPLEGFNADVVFAHDKKARDEDDFLMFGYVVDDPCDEAIMTDVA